MVKEVKYCLLSSLNPKVHCPPFAATVAAAALSMTYIIVMKFKMLILSNMVYGDCYFFIPNTSSHF